jgi:hypothetical protein
MKKICKRCCRNRKIGKFGNYKRSPDGKNYYCRDCMRDIIKAYKSTQKGKLVKEKSNKKWKKNNKEIVRQYNREYYKKKRNIILYNRRAKRDTECVLIIENPKKSIQTKINKVREVCIEINPKRKENGNNCSL